MVIEFPLNPTVSKMGASATLASKLRVAALRAEGKEIISFGIGESPFSVSPPIAKALQDNVHHTRYLPTAGILKLRQNISRFHNRYYGIDCSADDVLIGPGSKELLFDIMMAMDMDWMIPSPGWLSYGSQLKISENTFFKYSSNIENEYRFDEKGIRRRFEEIQEINDGKRMAMILNFPNNPTGMTLSHNEVRSIAKFAMNNEVLIVSDEIYSNVTHETYPEKHLSMAVEYPEGTLVTGGISKDRSQAGWRFGTLIVPESQPEIRRVVRTIGSQTFSCVSGPIQYAMITAYDENQEIHQSIVDSNAIHTIMGRVSQQILAEADFKVSTPEGAFYLMPSLDHKKDELRERGITTSREMMHEILEQYHVAAIPAEFFGLDPSDMAFRLAYIDYNGDRVMNAFRKNPDDARKDPMGFAKENAPTLIKGLNSLATFSNTL